MGIVTPTKVNRPNAMLYEPKLCLDETDCMAILTINNGDVITFNKD